MRLQTVPLLFLLFFCVPEVNAQDFNSALGIRFGSPWALSYKKFTATDKAFELYAGARSFRNYNWVSLNAAYQVHKDFPDTQGFQWYYGIGGGLQLWDYDFDNNLSNTSFSVSGYLGLQFTFPDFPLSLTLDWVPTYFLGRRDGLDFDNFGYGYGGLGARFVINR